MINLEQLLRQGEERLSLAGIEDWKTDAWYLMEYTFHMDRVSFWVNRLEEAPEGKQEKYLVLLEKRASHVPLQHITGEQEFMGLPFFVSRDVLIPRQDTEILVEEVMKYADRKAILDLCTGSGCIILSLSRLCRLERACGADLSLEALAIAEKNRHRLGAQASFIQSDLFEQVKGSFDIIVSNPPYIKSREIDTLMPEVRLFEPRLALDGSEDGLFFYRKIIKEAGDYLNSRGLLFFEIGADQGKAVAGLLEEAGYCQIEIIRDLAGLDRVVKGEKADV